MVPGVWVSGGNLQFWKSKPMWKCSKLVATPLVVKISLVVWKSMSNHKFQVSFNTAWCLFNKWGSLWSIKEPERLWKWVLTYLLVKNVLFKARLSSSTPLLSLLVPKKPKWQWPKTKMWTAKKLNSRPSRWLNPLRIYSLCCQMPRVTERHYLKSWVFSHHVSVEQKTKWVSGPGCFKISHPQILHIPAVLMVFKGCIIYSAVKHTSQLFVERNLILCILQLYVEVYNYLFQTFKSNWLLIVIPNIKALTSLSQVSQYISFKSEKSLLFPLKSWVEKNLAWPTCQLT